MVLPLVGKRLVGAFSALAVALLIGGVGQYYGEQQGIVKGIDMYHEQCYNGGIVIDQNTGKAVVCGPLTQLPKEERDLFKDRA